MSSPTLIGHLRGHAESTPHKLAIAHGDREVRYAELWTRILCAAGRLRDRGVRPEDRVLLAAAREPEFVSAYFACHLLGAVAVPVAPELVPETLATIVSTVRPRLACLSRQEDLACTCMTLSDLGRGEPARSEEFGSPDPDAPADMVLTGGATGKRKAAVLAHRNILAAARNINAFIGNTADDREAVALPLDHSFGLGRLRCQMLAGGAVIFTEGLMFPKKLFDAMRRWHATGFAFVPAGWAMLRRLTGDKVADFADQLRYIEIGSAPMPREEKERLMRLFPSTRICAHYGLTEASRSAFMEFHECRDRLDSIGRPSPNVEIRIVDADGRPLPPGEKGAIVIRGDHVMVGYWDAPAESRLRDGWLASGDIGYRSQDDYLYLSGRADDVINVGGQKVHPTEVEDALRQHEVVADCVCVGVSDPGKITGESVVAFVVAKEDRRDLPTPRELTDFLMRRLDRFKIPVAYDWVPGIPKNAHGKVERGVLKQQAMNRSQPDP